MRLLNRVVHSSPLSFATEEATTLHQPQMLRRQILGDATILGNFTDGITTVQQQLDHSQANRVGQGPKTFGRAAEGFQINR